MQDRKEGPSMGRATASIHRGGLAGPVYGEVSVPIFQTSTFGFPSAEAGAARAARPSEVLILNGHSLPDGHLSHEQRARLAERYQVLVWPGPPQGSRAGPQSREAEPSGDP